MGSNLIERTKFYLEIAHCSIDYCPPTLYFSEVLTSLTDSQLQINTLRQENNDLKKKIVLLEKKQ